MYGHSYIAGTLRANSVTAGEICRIRWEFVSEIRPRTVLDFGCGIGWFGAFAPSGVTVDTCDINPALQSLVTGIRHARYDLVTLWDVFEHIPAGGHAFLIEVLKMTDYVAVSIPVLPAGQNLFTWKHFKPGEHLYQFTPDSLEPVFRDWGFVKEKDGWPECGIRQDIYSVIFKKPEAHK